MMRQLTSSRSPAQRLLEEAKALENELAATCALKHTTSHSPKVIVLREKLKQCYVKLIFSDYAAASEADIEQRLWRKIFYAPIEELRSRWRQDESTNAATREKNQTHQLFSSFLKESEEFYKGFLQRLERTNAESVIVLPGGSPTKSPKKRNGAKAGSRQGRRRDYSFTYHKSLIFLGDILRYSQLYLKQHEQRSFKFSRFCYRQAAYVWPKGGNAHNQLAILSIHSKRDDLGAVYHYLRALHAETPFPTAEENLKLLLHRLHVRADALGETAPFSASHMILHFLKATHEVFAESGDLAACLAANQRFLRHLSRLCAMPPPMMRTAMFNFQKERRDSKLVILFIKVVAIAVCNVERAWQRRPAPPVAEGEGVGKTDDWGDHAAMLALTIQLEMVGASAKDEPCSHIFLPAIRVFNAWLGMRSNFARLRQSPSGDLQSTLDRYVHAIIALLKEHRDAFPKAGADNGCALVEDVELRGFVPLSQLGSQSVAYVAWQSAHRPIESNDRKAFRIVRMMNTVCGLMDDPDVFSGTDSGDARWERAMDGVERSGLTYKVWKGSCAPAPRGVIPRCSHVAEGAIASSVPPFNGNAMEGLRSLSTPRNKKMQSVWCAEEIERRRKFMDFKVHKPTVEPKRQRLTLY